jgi:hypothetical protein
LPETPPPHLWFSPRERQILLEICLSKSNKEIAASLDLAEGTIKNVISVLLGKMNKRLAPGDRRLQDRFDLYRWALQHPEDVRRGITRDTAIHQSGCRCGSPGCAAMLRIAIAA